MNTFLLSIFPAGMKHNNIGLYVGCTGILVNFLIFLIELSAGLAVNSTSLMADSFHNLIDAGFSVGTAAAFLLIGKPADNKHPFGFGRSEYLLSFCMGIGLTAIGIFFGRVSLEKIIDPEPMLVNGTAIITMMLAIVLKLGYSLLNRSCAEKIASIALKANYWETIVDVFTLLTALGSLAAAKFADIQLDGILGIVISGVIIYSGAKIMKKAADALIGESPNPAVVNTITTNLISNKYVAGWHNLVVHDYGLNKIVVSVHVEFPTNVSFATVHHIMADIERSLYESGIEVTIHPDPIKKT
ncbi:cation diffusion facilitator family transporter [Pectinatus frisingensis]|uniref:cation diffusion facilitator family transporter n=1 Tax=Pectinatus frisingensis TaxID=865 RepID=UPI0015F743F6|nr:cation diffusion facilitator family transporter [Pectinatus frisingensis]